MKYRRKVFEMNEKELRTVLACLILDRKFDSLSKSDMQEELVHWLLSRGMSVRHNFLLYQDEDTETNEDNGKQIWLLKGQNECDCCERNIESTVAKDVPPPYSTSASPCTPRTRIPDHDTLRKNIYAKSPIANSSSKSSLVSSATIVTQPKASDRDKTKFMSATKEKKKSTECCCRTYCVECGRFCVSILSTF
ncbi:hypothetical protein Ddc_05942 [Ditylenchus destructor]|nr:hypothetical protein Ddc_05942 [Ditylenchus destructor]